MRSTARTTFLADLLGTALEGGINYWAAIDRTEHAAAPEDVLGWRYDSARILDREDGSDFGTMHTIDLDTVAHGLTLMAANDNPRFDALRLANRTDGARGDFDAGDADAVVQLGLYEHIIYG